MCARKLAAGFLAVLFAAGSGYAGPYPALQPPTPAPSGEYPTPRPDSS